MELKTFRRVFHKCDEVIFKGDFIEDQKLVRERPVRLNQEIAGRLMISNYSLEGQYSVTLVIPADLGGKIPVSYIPLPWEAVSQILTFDRDADIDLKLSDLTLEEVVGW